MKKGVSTAFTLAEVLITIGIIGIVTAMTLPTLIAKHKIKVLQTQLKKSYSSLYDAYSMTKYNLGDVNIFNTYTTFNSTDRYVNSQAFIDEFYKNLKIVKKVRFYPVKNYSGTKTMTSDDPGNDYAKALNVLPDGSSVGVTVVNHKIRFWVDVNGPSKAPNRFGFDVFEFWVADASDAIVPSKTIRVYTEDELEGDYSGIRGYPCSKSSNQTANGAGCTYFAWNDINPDDETKTYWDNLPR